MVISGASSSMLSRPHRLIHSSVLSVLKESKRINMNSVLITGANRGIGLGLVKELLLQPQSPQFVLAIVRDSSRAQDLNKLADSHSNLRVIQCDISQFDQHEKLFEDIQTIVGDLGLDMLINNAGVCPASSTFENATAKDLDDCLHVNVKVPMILTQKLLPLLKKGAETNFSWIINISSTLGSISANCTAGYYPYRVSKAALNAFTKNLSIELKHDQIFSIVLHPGWVRTDMGGSSADISVEESCQGLMKVLRSLKPNQNGKFFQYNGQELPW